MMTELTEKVARAMSDALNVGKSAIVQWDRLHREERELYETAAQAAITTIEEERVGRWQPIETAPLDTPILIAVMDECGDCEMMTVASHLPEYVGTGHSEWMVEASAEAYVRTSPTHWMPLPCSPSLI